MRRRRTLRASRVFTVGPWREGDGDPGGPGRVLGVPVAERLDTRPDGRGALVRLADGRFALTGQTVAVGLRSQLEGYLRRQRGGSGGDQWIEGVGSLLRHRASERIARRAP
ncbi:MAG: hypothetical protein GEU88_10530 [Solirubrobacterales bacterium]|nr:hypothetical protein [Solirubrobacterales bacterium]